MNAKEAEPIGDAVSRFIQNAYATGVVEPGEAIGNKDLEDGAKLIGAVATLEALVGKAKRNELTVDDVVTLESLSPKKSFWERAKRALEMPLVGDENTLENMRLVSVLKLKLDEETAKIQEDDGWATVIVNGKPKQKKLDLRDPKNLENWRRDRAENLATQYRLKMQPKIEAERKKTEEFIAKRSPVVAKASKLISDGFTPPRMSPTGSDDEGFRLFQLKYGRPLKYDKKGNVTEAELTTDAYQNLIADYKNQMEGASGGSSMGGGVGFIIRDLLMPNLDVLLPVFTQSADPTLDQRERYEKLKTFAGALDAVSAELKKKSILKFLATKGDAEVTAMLNQKVASQLSKTLDETRQLAIGPLLKSAPIVVSQSFTVDGIDDIAAMEFGSRRKRRRS